MCCSVAQLVSSRSFVMKAVVLDFNPELHKPLMLDNVLTVQYEVSA